MAAFAGVCHVARGALLSIDCRPLAVNIVAPANGVRRRTHGPVTLLAALLRSRSRRQAAVADIARRAWFRRHGLVIRAEGFVVECRLDEARIARQRDSGFLIGVAASAIVHALAQRQLLAVAGSTLVHAGKRHRRQGRAVRHVLVARGAVHIELAAM